MAGGLELNKLIQRVWAAAETLWHQMKNTTTMMTHGQVMQKLSAPQPCSLPNRFVMSDRKGLGQMRVCSQQLDMGTFIKFFFTVRLKTYTLLIKGQATRYFPCAMRVHFIRSWRSAARGRVMPTATEKVLHLKCVYVKENHFIENHDSELYFIKMEHFITTVV